MQLSFRMRWAFSADRPVADDQQPAILSYGCAVRLDRPPDQVGRMHLALRVAWMNIAEMVARHAVDERRPSAAIVVRPSAEAFASVLTGGPVVLSWDEHAPEEPGTRTVVEVIAPGKEMEQIAELSALLGDTDVAILLFSPQPEALPVGVVTDTLSRHGLTVLDGCGTGYRSGRTTLAVSRDSERRQRVYLTGTPIPDDEPGRLRQRNEWVVEGLQMRSSMQVLERRLEGQAAELSQARTERRLLEQELTQAGELSARLSVLEGELAAVPAEDPAKGSGRIVRAIGRRWRR